MAGNHYFFDQLKSRNVFINKKKQEIKNIQFFLNESSFERKILINSIFYF